MNDDLRLADAPAACRTGAAQPDTPSARANNARFLRAIDRAGTRALSVRIGHSQGWVTRLKTDESRMSLTELLILLDETGMNLCDAGGSGATESLLALARIGLESVSTRRPPEGVGDEEFRALLSLARGALSRMESTE